MQNQAAIDIFADNMKLPRDIAKKAVFEFYPKAGLQIGEIKGLDLTLQDALDYKYITSAEDRGRNRAALRYRLQAVGHSIHDVLPSPR